MRQLMFKEAKNFPETALLRNGWEGLQLQFWLLITIILLMKVSEQEV